MERTKQQILDRNGFDFEAFEFENEYSAKGILDAMDEWSGLKSKRLLYALKKAKETIKTWHSIREGQRSSLVDVEKFWRLYNENAPEMKHLNTVIAEAEKLKSEL